SGGVNAVESHVRGFFSTEAKAYDDVAIRLPIRLAQELLRVAGANVWVIALDSTDRTPVLVEMLRRQFGGAGLQFVPWFELSDFYNKTVALMSRQMNVVQALIGLLIVLGISNILIMNVLERTGEIGTVLALGARRRKVLALFLAEGLVLGLAGAVAGLVIGLALAQLISVIGIPMPPPPGRTAGYTAHILVTWRIVFGAAALVIGTAALAGVYPAWKASRLEIVDALRHNR
ncbi:MAG TPA: FtsX-like permease family protein, partial [Terriglobia bacterium]|nr:FtsX-like permease family protein [Terriglobia bacterium]